MNEIQKLQEAEACKINDIKFVTKCRVWSGDVSVRLDGDYTYSLQAHQSALEALQEKKRTEVYLKLKCSQFKRCLTAVDAPAHAKAWAVSVLYWEWIENVEGAELAEWKEFYEAWRPYYNPKARCTLDRDAVLMELGASKNWILHCSPIAKGDAVCNSVKAIVKKG